MVLFAVMLPRNKDGHRNKHHLGAGDSRVVGTVALAGKAVVAFIISIVNDVAGGKDR